MIKKSKADIERLYTLCQDAFVLNPIADLAKKLYQEGWRWNTFIETCNASGNMSYLKDSCRMRLTNYLSDLEKGVSLPIGNSLLP